MVEHLLAKEKVAGSNPVFRSKETSLCSSLFRCFRVFLASWMTHLAGVAEWQTLRS